jgi:hypothetical protein
MQLKKNQQNGEISPRVSQGEPTMKKPIKNNEPNMKTKVKKAKRKSYSGYKDIVRDKTGLPKMPLCLGELTVENLGNIFPHSPYITEKHIWPVGFKSFRYFSSMNNPEMRVKYTSQILEGGEKPQFVVTAEDDQLNPIVSYSPSGAWRTVLKRVMSKSTSEEARKNVSVSGTLRFGLAHPIVSHLIRELPGAEKCKDNGGSWSSSPSNSPSLARKRRTEDDVSEGEESDESYGKRQKKDSSDEDYTVSEYESHFSTRGVSSRKEIDDLESAVATLQALKYCAVY